MEDKQNLHELPDAQATAAKAEETLEKALPKDVPVASNAKSAPKSPAKPRAKPPAKPKVAKAVDTAKPEVLPKAKVAPKAKPAPASKPEATPAPTVTPAAAKAAPVATSAPVGKAASKAKAPAKTAPKAPAKAVPPPAQQKPEEKQILETPIVAAKAPSAIKSPPIAKPAAKTASSPAAAKKPAAKPAESQTKPDIKTAEPTENLAKPTAKTASSPATAKKPAAKQAESQTKPDIKTAEPTENLAKPTAKTASSPAAAKKPAAKQAESQTKPDIKTAEPTENLAKPAAKTASSPATGKKPAAKQAKPAAKSATPAAKAAPKAASKAPSSATEQPASPASAKAAAEPAADNALKASAAQSPKATAKSAPKANIVIEPKAAAKTPAPKPKAPPRAPKKPSRPSPALLAVGGGFKKAWPNILHPIVALVVICLVTSLLLGVTNEVTKPLIEANATAAADAARSVLLPEADGFEEIFFPEDFKGIKSLYQATNKTGYIIEAYAKGYNGNVSVMVGFSAENRITGVHFLPNNETPGLGKKLNTDPKFAAQFVDRSLQHFEISQKELDGGITKIASATISTGGAVEAVNRAIDFYGEKVLGKKPRPSTPEEINPVLLPDAKDFAKINLSMDNVSDAYHTGDGRYIIYTTSPGYVYAETKDDNTRIQAAVAMDEDGAILALWLNTGGETPGKGSPLQDDEGYTSQFTGKTPADVFAQQGNTPPRVEANIVAGATVTSDAVAEAVATALNALQAAKEAA